MIRKSLLIIIILFSLEFYQLTFIPEGIIKVSELVSIGIIAALILINLVYGRTRSVKMRFALPILLIFISVIISMFGAYLFQNQSFANTAYGQKAIYFYLIYFLLHLMKMEDDFVIKTILSLGLVYIALYLLQYFIYPVEITRTKMFMDRGTVRIFLAGAGYLVVAYFIWLYLAVKEYKLKYVFFLLLALGIFVLLGTRQILATVFLLTLLFLFQSRLIKSKVLIFTLFALALIPVFFIFKDIFMAMYADTLEQSQNIQTDNRFEAAVFFLTKFFPSDLAYLTGNGSAYNSLYKLRLLRYSEQYGYYLSDIGLIGEYVKYGMIFVFAIFMMLYRVLRAKLTEKFMFIKYNFLSLLLALLTAGAALGSDGMSIVVNSMLLYLVDLNLSEEQPEKLEAPDDLTRS
jgi:hypothetical protein